MFSVAGSSSCVQEKDARAKKLKEVHGAQRNCIVQTKKYYIPARYVTDFENSV